MPLSVMFYCKGRAVLALCLIAFTALSIGGCAGIWQDSPAQQAPMNSEEVTAFIQEWQEVKPQINELAALREDLAMILAEVDRQSGLTDLPPQYAEQRPVDNIVAENDDDFFAESTEATMPESQDIGSNQNGNSSLSPPDSGMSLPEGEAEEVAERQFYAAHLAYFISEPAAKQGWFRLIRQFPALSEAVQVKVFAEQQGEQTLHSLRIGPFETVMATTRVCQVFSSLNFKCRPVTFDGKLITAASSFSRIAE